MLKRMITACFLSILLAALLTGCNGNKSDIGDNSAGTSNIQEPAQPAVSNQNCTWAPDGKISDNEYSSCQSVGDIKVFTRVVDDSVMFGLTANTEGYLALGIDPEGYLKDVDMIMCAIIDGSIVVGDHSGGGKHWPHPADIDAGGKMDLTDIGGGRDGTAAVFEFSRKLDTGDGRDKALQIGENRVIWALGKTSDFNGPHSRRGSGALILQRNY